MCHQKGPGHDAKGLGDEMVVDDWDAFSAGYQDYLAETVSRLDALSPDDFEPNPETHEAVIQSLTVDTP